MKGGMQPNQLHALLIELRFLVTPNTRLQIRFLKELQIRF